MLHLAVLSDWHIDSSEVSRMRQITKEQFKNHRVDAVIVAGDVAESFDSPTYLRKVFPDHEVYYVLGNHEFYNREVMEARGYYEERARVEGIHLLKSGDIHSIEDGLNVYHIVGDTMWTDFGLVGDRSKAMLDASFIMNDYRKIYISPPTTAATPFVRQLVPQDTVHFHEKFRFFLDRVVDAVKNDDLSVLGENSKGVNNRLIVVTHHAPHIRSSRPSLDEAAPAYMVDMSHWLSPKISCWVHGHTHYNVDYKQNGTRIVSQAKGYFWDKVQWKFIRVS